MLIWTDGSSRGNPGLAGIGVVLQVKDGSILTFSKFIGDNKTNNEAEYEAVLEAVKKAREYNKSKEDVTIYTDSKVIHGQLVKGWKVNYPHLQKLKIAVMNELSKADFRISIEHTVRKHQLANEYAQAVTQEEKERRENER